MGVTTANTQALPNIRNKNDTRKTFRPFQAIRYNVGKF